MCTCVRTPCRVPYRVPYMYRVPYRPLCEHHHETQSWLLQRYTEIRVTSQLNALMDTNLPINNLKYLWLLSDYQHAPPPPPPGGPPTDRLTEDQFGTALVELDLHLSGFPA